MNITLHPKQGQFVGSKAHNLAFVGGIGSGKSMAGCVRGLLASQGYVGSKQLLQTPNLGVITAPTYPMLKDATVRTFLEIAGDAVVQFNRTPGDMLAVMSNGSEILFRSTDNPDRLRGPSVSWWFGDEAALYADDVYRIMVGRLRQFGKQGWAWLATTPRGRNWVWRLFVRDNAAKRDWRLIQAASRENIFLDDSILEMWESVYSGDFADQELGGDFVAFEGLIYSEFDRLLHIRSQTPERFDRYIAGVDWGYSNPGVMLVFGLDSDSRMWLVEEQYQRQRQIDEWVDVAKQIHQTYNVSDWYCDPAEPKYIKKLRDGGLRGVTAANNSVQPGIQEVKARLKRQGDGLPRLLLTRASANTIGEFDSYQWAPGARRGEGHRDEPLKTKDHAMDALRYAVMGLGTPRKLLHVGAQPY